MATSGLVRFSNLFAFESYFLNQDPVVSTPWGTLITIFFVKDLQWYFGRIALTCIARRLGILHVFVIPTFAMALEGRKLEGGINILTLMTLLSMSRLNVWVEVGSYWYICWQNQKWWFCIFPGESTPVELTDGLNQPLLCLQCTAWWFNPLVITVTFRRLKIKINCWDIFSKLKIGKW